jgi:hypothetical protein
MARCCARCCVTCGVLLLATLNLDDAMQAWWGYHKALSKPGGYLCLRILRIVVQLHLVRAFLWAKPATATYDNENDPPHLPHRSQWLYRISRSGKAS